MRLFVKGHTAVAHWRRPRARSMDLAVIAAFWMRSSKTSNTSVCLVAIIWTWGMFGWMTNPSQVFTSARSVFFQLSGTPRATNVASMEVAIWSASSAPRSQQKSSTNTAPVDLWKEVVQDSQEGVVLGVQHPPHRMVDQRLNHRACKPRAWGTCPASG